MSDFFQAHPILYSVIAATLILLIGLAGIRASYDEGDDDGKGGK